MHNWQVYPEANQDQMHTCKHRIVVETIKCTKHEIRASHQVITKRNQGKCKYRHQFYTYPTWLQFKWNYTSTWITIQRITHKWMQATGHGSTSIMQTRLKWNHIPEFKMQNQIQFQHELHMIANSRNNRAFTNSKKVMVRKEIVGSLHEAVGQEDIIVKLYQKYNIDFKCQQVSELNKSKGAKNGTNPKKLKYHRWKKSKTIKIVQIRIEGSSTINQRK